MRFCASLLAIGWYARAQDAAGLNLCVCMVPDFAIGHLLRIYDQFGILSAVGTAVQEQSSHMK